MDLPDILELMPKNNWISIISNIEVNRPSLRITKDEFQEIIDETILHIQNNHKGRCFDCLTLVLWIDKNKAFAKLKRKGFFRIYSYILQPNYTKEIATFLLQNSTILKLDDHDIKYLNSVYNLSTLHPVLKKKREKVIREISRRKKTIVKSLYSYVDYIFQKGRHKEENEPEDLLDKFSPEEIAEGASYIISLFKDLHKFTDDYIVLSDTKFITDKGIEKILSDACHIKLIQESEIFVESLEHSCEKINSEIIIRPPSPEFGKSYQLGNILLEMNREGQRILPEKSASIFQLVKNFNVQTENVILQWDDKWQRYVLAIPEEIYAQMYDKDMLLSDGVFHEEILFFMEVKDELFLSFKKFQDFEIVPGLNFYDLHIIRRVFSFISLAYFDLLEKKSLTEYHNSNIPFLHSKTIKTLLAPAIGTTKTDIFLKTFSYSNESKIVFDMQYTPLLRGLEHYLIPYNVFIRSNLFRNILFPLNSRLFDSTVDPISDTLQRILTERGFLVKRDLKYKYNNQNSDIDVIAIKGNNIFLFECKNSVLPVNAFESRTTYQELKKAAEKQLPISLSACKDLKFLKRYGLKIEDEKKPINIYPCIVTTNRLFSGLVLNGIPIRNIKHLNTFIKTGETGFMGIEEDENAIYSTWANNNFDVSDLIQYLQPDTKLYSYFFDSMDEYLQKYDLGELSISFCIYSYNEDLLIENFKKLNLKKKRNFIS